MTAPRNVPGELDGVTEVVVAPCDWYEVLNEGGDPMSARAARGTSPTDPELRGEGCETILPGERLPIQVHGERKRSDLDVYVKLVGTDEDEFTVTSL